MNTLYARLAMLAVLTVMCIAPVSAQQTPDYVGPGPSSGELAAMAQTPGATGDQERHYFFDAADREMGYHLYVPQRYDASAPAPLVVLLHGYSLNYKFFFSYVEDLDAQCERYGFICVAPMGYSTSGWYGTPMVVPGPPPAGSTLPDPQSGTPDERLRERELSEMDVMNVIDIVRGEYNVDPDRLYLMGHSMGGFGTWSLGQKYVDMWAAIAPMSGINDKGLLAIDGLTLNRTPVMLAVGGEEPQVVESKQAIAKLRAAGGEAHYVEIPDGTHMSMVAPATAQVLAFFATH